MLIRGNNLGKLNASKMILKKDLLLLIKKLLDKLVLQVPLLFSIF